MFRWCWRSRSKLSWLVLVGGCGAAPVPEASTLPPASPPPAVVTMPAIETPPSPPPAAASESALGDATLLTQSESETPADALARLDLEAPEVARLTREYLKYAGPPEGRLELTRVRPYLSLPAAVVEFRTEDHGLERRFFGLIGSEPSGDRTLELQPPTCGELVDDVLDLHGDGGRWLLFTEVGGGHHCHLTGRGAAYEFVAGKWIESAYAPDRPPSHDVDGDGVLDFPRALFTYDLGDCVYSSCGDYFFRVDVDGYESWDGKRFSSKGRYRAYYRQQFETLAREARGVPSAQGESCARDRIRQAALVFSFGVLAGKGTQLPLTLSRRWLAGLAAKQRCEEGELLGPQAVVAELLVAVPELERLR